jgi:hypothetical protein
VAAALIAFVIGTIFTDYARAVRQRRVQHPGESLCALGAHPARQPSPMAA